ncbi:PilZ domain-containing protein [Halobacteriovorax marinus]|uniref:PilZ domain-containing protein n=1 Tax=Halobacteriovorax marinus TaxID=97084 RepID=UPI003A8D5103
MIQDGESIHDEFEIHSFFRVLNQSKAKIWLWQRKDEKRVVQYAVVRKVDLIKQVVHIAPCSSKGFKFTSIDEFFFFNAQKSLAFKFSARDLTKDMIIFPIPNRILKVSNDFLKNIELVEKENEDKFKHLRNAPRVQPQGQQQVTIKRLLLSGEYSHQESFPLYDMSSGGMGIKVIDPSEFDIGDLIQVVAINAKEAPKKMSGEVVSIRQAEDDSSVFKVGIKFSN